MTKYIYDERTAPSAPICTFEDGADAVPCKNVVATIAPNLAGVSSVTETQTGLQIADFENNLNSTSYGCTIEKVNVGGIRFYGTTTQTYLNLTSLFDCVIKSGVSITLSRATARPYRVYVYLKFEDNTTANVIINQNTASVSYTTAKKVVQIRLDASGLTASTAYDETLYIVLQYGSTAHAYEPYTAPTTYTAQLGRTVYGGTADLVTGEGVETSAKQTFTGNETWTWHSSGFWYTSKPESNIATVRYYICSNGVDISYAPNGQVRCYANRNVGVVDDQTDMNALMDSATAFRYDLDTPTDFTFEGQEIPTTQGYNAFWSDSGNTEVTYYIQIPVEEKYIINGEILSDIADAIREKKETVYPILTEDMADEIRSIEMGGSDLLDLASQNTFDFTDDTYKTSALTIPDRMFNNNQRIRTVNISGIKTVESYAFIQCKATSLSFPDVETIGYQAFFQCRGASDVPLSIPNVVTIGEEAFKEAYVCGESPSYRFLDISKCVSIGHNAFRSTRINGFKMDSVETLGNNPWFGSWFSMTTVVFPKLKTAGSQMCRGITFTNLVIGPDWQSCGGGFAGYDMDWRNKYVYVYAITPPTMGGDFSLWKPPVAFYVPADSVDAYKAAPYWSQYASIILPLPSDHLTIDTWL